jgi:phosphatidylserine/phosphatidylglycerophosphate/cardiolipin synthase-like enzyme
MGGMALLRSRSLASAVALGFVLSTGALACGAAAAEDDDGSAESAYTEGSLEARAILGLVNDPVTNSERLLGDVRITTRASANILAHRDGADGKAGTRDDDRFDTLKELDDISYVGPATLKSLYEYAKSHGYGGAAGRSVEVVFSPQAMENSHLAKVASVIDGAQKTVDILMYSYSAANISDAIARAVARGVKVRFVFETAGEDKSLTGDALAKSKSGQLEAMGVDVRYVNKIMHHKVLIVDGPRDDEKLAATARITTGSANWSSGAATNYDENTLVFTGYPELALELQRDFNLLWDHSKDFVSGAAKPADPSKLTIIDSTIPDDPNVDAFFTSANFDVTDSTFRGNGKNTISDALILAIQNAKKSIHVASGHLRHRAVAEALIAKAKASPNVDIKVYLDAQEYISEASNAYQEKDLATCLAGATTPAQTRTCTDKGFLYGYEVGNSNIDVRYKFYSYRWDNSYAKQMHDKYFVFDGETLYSGSYNLSDNAEHDTFENMLVFRGAEHAALVRAYEANFASIREVGRSSFTGLQEQIKTADPLPIVFAPVALDWDEVTALKTLIRANCTAIDTQVFRIAAAQHQTCKR